MDKLSFSEAKERLADAMSNDGDCIKIDRETAEILQGSWPPDDEPPLSKSAYFNPKYMEFLRPVVEANMEGVASFKVRGISVLPAPTKGVLLCATNGTVLAIAHDENGALSEGAKDGFRFTVPMSFFDACKPPKPFSLQWGGNDVDIEDSIPDFAKPGLVHATGICLLLMPEGQPEGTDEFDGGALFN